MKWLTENFPLKLFSLIISLMLWFFVAYEVDKDQLKQVTIPLEFRGLKEGLTVQTPLSMSIQVGYLTKSRLQNRINTSDVKVWVDVSTLDKGDKAKLEVEASVPFGKVSTKTPPIVEVKVDSLMSREEPVEVVLMGDPGKGKLIGQSSISPSIITILGPASLMPRLGGVRVEVDASRFAHSPKAMVEPGLIGINSEHRAYFTTIPELVEVSVQVLDKSAVRNLPVMPRITGLPALGWTLGEVTVEPKDIELRGSEIILEGFHFLETDPLDISDKRETITRELSLFIPRGLVSDIKKVRVTAPLRPHYPSKILRMKVPTLFGKPSPEVMGIEVFAPQKTLSTLKSREFAVLLDAPISGKSKVRVQAPKDQTILYARPLFKEVQIVEKSP